MDTSTALRTVTAATRPEDLFGPVTGTDPNQARSTYLQLLRALHPDRTHTRPDGPDCARAAARLTEHHDLWRRAAHADHAHTPTGSTNTPPTVTVTGENTAWTLTTPLPTRGTWHTLFHAHDPHGNHAIARMVRNPHDNPRTTSNTVPALTAIGEWADKHAHWARPYFPLPIDTATHTDPAGAKRHITIMSDLCQDNGFVNLAHVLERFPAGIDGRDFAWMLRRLLRAVAATNQAGWTHGSITPANVLIHPQMHGVVLTGWSTAVPNGKPVRVHDPDLAGNPTNDMAAVRALAQQLLHPTATDHARETDRLPNDPVAALPAYDAALERLYGPRTWREFPFPTNGPGDHPARPFTP